MDRGVSAPLETFDRVSDPTRMSILRALAVAARESPTDPWLDYADLRRAAGVEDKGNFNYHLDRLGDLMVKGSSGYRLSRVGFRVVATVAAGGLDRDWTWGPVEVPGECQFCGDPLSLRYEDGAVELGCGTDGHALVLPGSPALLDAHPEAAAAELVSTLVRREVELVCRGVCAVCQGAVDGRVERGDVGAAEYHYHGECSRCGLHYPFAVGLLALVHPDVVAFLAEHGTDIRSVPFWTLAFCRAGAETVDSTDPLRLRVGVERGGETLSLTLDAEGTVVGVERSG